MCGEEKPKELIMAWYFNCGIIPQKYTISMDPDTSDKHICVDCLNVVSDQIKSNKSKRDGE